MRSSTLLKVLTVLKSFTIALLLMFVSAASLFARDIDIDRLSADAAKAHKHLFVWLHKTDCGYCESMREFTLEDDAVAPLVAESFVFVHINVYDKDVVTYKALKSDGKTFAKKVGFSFYPSSLFFDANGEIIFAAPGYIEERDFMMMLKFVKSGAYTEMGYDCFRRKEEKR